MGVTYKLSPQVVDFIKDKKSADPKISCRKLSDLASEEFQTKISKSSVNNVLKGLELSNPVGRPPKSRRKKAQFRIPVEKKETIRASIEGILKSDFKVIDTDIPKNEEITEKEVRSEEIKVTLDEGSIDEKAPDVKVHNTYDASNDKKEEIVQESVFPYNPKRLNKKEIAFAGSVFLKAVEWMLFEKPPLPGLFQRVFSKYSLKDAEIVSSAMIFSCMMNVKKDEVLQIEHDTPFFTKDTLAQLINQKNDFWIDALTVTNSTALQYLSQKQEKRITVAGIKIQYEDGVETILDPKMSTIIDGKYDYHCTIDQAVRRVSSMLISNTRPCVFYHIEEKSAEAFRAFRENSLRKLRMQSVRLIDYDQRDVLIYKAIPHNQRQWMFGIYPNENQFSDIEKVLKWTNREMIYDCFLEQDYFYSEAQIDVFDDNEKMRCIGVYDLKESLRCILVTNMAEKPAQDVIKSYLIRWPQFENISLVSFDVTEGKKKSPFSLFYDVFKGESKESFASADEVLEDFVQFLHKEAFRYFFPGKEDGASLVKAIEAIYSLSGKVYEAADVYKVAISLKGCKKAEEVCNAVKIVNAQEIYTHKKQRVWVEVENQI